MGKISATDSLKESIYILETKKSQEWQGLKDHFYLTYQSLKPANLLQSAIDDMSANYNLKADNIDSVMGLLGGFLTQKLVERSTKNPIMRLLGVALQFGVANLIIKNGENIRTVLYGWLEKLFKSKEVEEE